MPLDEVVIFDADTNTIESPFDDVAQLPSDAVSFNYWLLLRPNKVSVNSTIIFCNKMCVNLWAP